MRRLFTIVCLLVSVVGKGQCDWRLIAFDADTCHSKLIVIDTVNYHHNLWQIGTPHKANLDSPYSPLRVIITDTLNTYPPSDTSVFILKVPVAMPAYPGSSWLGALDEINFRYRLDINSNYTAFVELSVDSGLHWFNVVDTLPAHYHCYTSGFDISTNYWLSFTLTTPYVSSFGDSLLLKFTFISDSLATGKDGWMIDDINMMYWWESVSLLQNPNLITLYPNPSHGNIYIHADKPHKDATITIQNIAGQQVYSGAAPVNGYLNLQLPDGVYTLRYSDDEEYCVKRVVIQT